MSLNGKRPGSIGIVGAGTMGCGIAAAILSAGWSVAVTDANMDTLSHASERIGGLLAQARDVIAPGKLTVVETIHQLADCDLIVEAVFEDMDVKQALINALDAVAKPGAILASNTSYLDLDAIARATSRPESVIGLHFFAPAHIMRLLEIVRGAKTSAKALATALAFGRRLRKVSVVAGVCEGFIGNRIYNAYRAECEAMLLEGAQVEQVDAALQAFGFAMGPFAVSDMSGLDIAWANRRRRQVATSHRQSDVPVLEWLVDEGRLGRKTEAGWYRYEAGSAKPLVDGCVTDLLMRASREHGVIRRPFTREDIQQRSLTAIVNEALLVLEDGIAQRASDIDIALVYGYGFPKHLGGPLYWAAREDQDVLRGRLDEMAAREYPGFRRGDLARLCR